MTAQKQEETLSSKEEATRHEQRNTAIFEKLKAQQNEIEQAFHGELIWQELPKRRACKICVKYLAQGLNDENHWDEIINFFADNLAELIKVFKPLLDKILKGL